MNYKNADRPFKKLGEGNNQVVGSGPETISLPMEAEFYPTQLAKNIKKMVTGDS
jgi:hypothetical protein